MRFLKNGKLEDKKIIASLHQAAEDYENGEIVEVRDLLLDIINAIDEFADIDENEDGEDCEENNCEAGTYDCDTCPNNGDCIRQNE